MQTIYEQLNDARCQIDHHESDLYVKASAVSSDIIGRYQRANGKPLVVSYFPSAEDGSAWIEIAFAYDPWWVKRCGGK